jgi:hypothetical protein
VEAYFARVIDLFKDDAFLLSELKQVFHVLPNELKTSLALTYTEELLLLPDKDNSSIL